MVNYNNGKVYKIINENREIVYIGSTAQVMLCDRYKTHSHKAPNHKIILIENYSCNSKEELCKREQEIIDEHSNLLNKLRAFRSEEYIKEYRKEITKEYRENNKEKIKEKKKEYDENNKEKIKEQKKEWYENNKDQMKEYNKEWYENNKEKLKEKRKEHYENNKDKLKEKITCEYCNCEIQKCNLRKHQKSLKCMKLH